MPRPKRKSGNTKFSAKAHRLSDHARKDLIGALSLDLLNTEDELFKANQALEQVAKCLSSYGGADKVLRNAPKPSDFVRSMSMIERDTAKLLSNINDAHQWVLDELVRTNTDLEKLKLELEKLQGASLCIKDKYAGIESRGAPKQEALRHVILVLREIFDQYYQGPITSRREIGYIEPLSEYENEERDFIKFALDDAKIPCTKKDLNRILAEPSMTVQSGMHDRIDLETDAKWERDIERNLLENKDE